MGFFQLSCMLEVFHNKKMTANEENSIFVEDKILPTFLLKMEHENSTGLR